MSEAEFSHLPVMVREVVELLLPVPEGLIVDCTVGGAGHSRALLDARPDLNLLGIDRDTDAATVARQRLAPYGARAQVVVGGFERLAELVDRYSEGERVMGILMDLGVSSPQLDRPERGFSYRFDAPLDMRMDAKQALTAADVVNGYDVEDLAGVISRNGEERFARRIARGIAAARPLRTTRELVDVIRDAIPAPARRRGGHPARRTFQAIRMEVNRELPNLADGLGDSVHVIGPEGRVLVLAYHSLEDRMVKETFAGWADTGSAPALPKLAIQEPKRSPLVRLLTRRPLRPRADEVAANRRAESVRLRAVERLPDSA
jgi:16S rRNA (cytosine1402-N4)-methyltransferase